LLKIGENSDSKSEKQISATRKIYFNALKYAAVAVLVLSVGTLIYLGINRKNPNTETQQLVFTEIELPKTIILPDSSVVTLNKETEIFYPEVFSGASRNVEIIGEAFFEVTPNPQIPFIIKAGNTQIKVLGTSFNVYAYPASETVEVVVETGKVQVSGFETEKQNPEDVFLEPGEKATFNKKDKKLSKQKNNDPNYNSWKTYSLVFKESKLSYVIDVLEKTYHVEIQAENPEIENEVLVAEFNNKPIEFILDVIRLTFNLELSVEDGRYILKSSNS
ncbi:MAG: FecR domain-containing protein, partial [Prolixibacteraceae bacterium]|nr:FecR domain-containing protein [Prolixibacteraceae bacterium]MBN2775404.1 FecR domain-containing protein [Prolixibacteraceae bacterium]